MRIAEFLEIKNIDEKIIEDVVDKSAFSKMKYNTLIYSNLMRKGIKLNFKHYNVFRIQYIYLTKAKLEIGKIISKRNIRITF